MRDCCEGNMVWVQKYSDLDVPQVDQQGKPTGEVEYVDVDFYRCKFCGTVRAEAE